MLIESAKPVAKVSNSNAATVIRSDTGEATGIGCSMFRRIVGPSRYTCGVRSSEVMVVILVTSQRLSVRFMNSR